jgi:hypothetical protein
VHVVTTWDRKQFVGILMWLLSASELYRLNDRIPTAVNFGFLHQPLHFLPSSSSVILMRLISFQTHYFSQNLGAPGIEPGTVARNSEH